MVPPFGAELEYCFSHRIVVGDFDKVSRGHSSAFAVPSFVILPPFHESRTLKPFHTVETSDFN